MTLSLDTELQVDMALRPNFNLRAIDSAIKAMQSQINELAEQRHQNRTIYGLDLYYSHLSRTCTTDGSIRIAVTYRCDIYSLRDIRVLESRTLFRLPRSGGG